MTEGVKKAVNEELMLQIVRNALLVAGKEMGDGDHTPVINATIHGLAKDWEDIKNKRAAISEVQKHCDFVIAELTDIRNDARCEDHLRASIDTAIGEIKDAYDAAFAPVDPGEVYMDPTLVNLNYKRAERIIRSLEDAHE
jgi:hypothetical protein